MAGKAIKPQFIATLHIRLATYSNKFSVDFESVWGIVVVTPQTFDERFNKRALLVPTFLFLFLICPAGQVGEPTVRS
jgi:hypothetical protein